MKFGTARAAACKFDIRRGAVPSLNGCACWQEPRRIFAATSSAETAASPAFVVGAAVVGTAGANSQPDCSTIGPSHGDPDCQFAASPQGRTQTVGHDCLGPTMTGSGQALAPITTLSHQSGTDEHNIYARWRLQQPSRTGPDSPPGASAGQPRQSCSDDCECRGGVLSMLIQGTY